MATVGVVEVPVVAKIEFEAGGIFAEGLGYQRGFDAGYDEGLADGQEEGYQRGFDAGYQHCEDEFACRCRCRDDE